MRFFLTTLGAVLLTMTLDSFALAQSESPPPDLPFPDPTDPTRPAPLNPPIPTPPPEDDPLRQAPGDVDVDEGVQIPGADNLLFTVDRIEVVGNTVLQADIDALTSPLEGQQVSLSQLLDLRAQITDLYVRNGYVTSGAFLPNNQDLTDGIIQIQVIEGSIETIQVNGLGHLREGYVRDRIAIATDPPLQVDRLQDALRLLQIDPLLERIDAELTAGSSPGQNILVVDAVEADPFTLGFTVDNARATSIGSTQGEVLAFHGNVLGFGDFASARYNFTEGLDLYELRYGFPLNAYDGTLQVRYENASSRIITPQFLDAGIRNESETFSVYLRQPLTRSINQEFALGLAFDLRESRSFILNDIPFSFSIGPEDGVARVSALRFSQEWLTRDISSVVAMRSQFSLGLDIFNATVNDTGTDGQFFSWLGQFQWVEQFAPGLLLVSRVNSQLTPDSLLPLEKFSVGGIDTVRGYAQNQLVTDNAVVGSVELRVPLSSIPNELQLVPFVDFGTGWNNQTENPNPNVLVGTGLGLRWQPVPEANFSLTYGIPLVSVADRGNSWQENGIYFSFSVRPF
jgi:hemolysin activation/secretion protein